MPSNVDYLIDDLCKQIAKLAHEKATFYALASQKEMENQALRKELDEFKKQSPTQ